MLETPKLAFIMRSDEIINEFNLKRTTIHTSFGPVHRCYVGKIFEIPVLIIHGRFNGQKVPSSQINAQQNIEVVVNSGAESLIGTYVVGGIKKENPIGSVYIIDDLVGMGNYSISWNQNVPFHNAEMYSPFCKNITEHLRNASSYVPFKVLKSSTYVCFHGWPRIETKAEIEFYEKMGWDIVGQTLDPEATQARLSGLCYGAIAVQVDDPLQRESTSNSNLKEESNNGEIITNCRKKTSALILEFIKNYKSKDCTNCNHINLKNNSFKQFPNSFYE